MAHEIVDVSEWPVQSQEPGGVEPKDWVARPDEVGLRGREHLWLYKRVKRGVRSGYRRYDDISELLASMLADAISLPAAEVRLARRRDDEGIISHNVVPDGWDMYSGDTLLSECPGYGSCSGDGRPKNREGHNLTNIAAVLDGCGGPPRLCADWSAFDVFAGFLVFDAWIANTDRHAINWAVLERGGQRRLAPSFDHGSALASGIRDGDLARQDPVRFARGGMAGRFEGGADRALVDLARDAARLGGPRAQEWLERVASFDLRQLDELLDAVVTLSVRRRTFLRVVLLENQGRLRV